MTALSLSPAFGPLIDRDCRASQPSVRQASAPSSSAPAMAGAAWAVQLAQADASLTVTTGDGDRVTLSLSAQSLLAAPQFRAASGESGESLAAAQTTGVALSVEGSLDKEEVLDLARLFRTFARALRDVFRGDPARAVERMSRPQALDSLAGFSYSMAHQTQTAVRSVQQAG